MIHTYIYNTLACESACNLDAGSALAALGIALVAVVGIILVGILGAKLIEDGDCIGDSIYDAKEKYKSKLINKYKTTDTSTEEVKPEKIKHTKVPEEISYYLIGSNLKKDGSRYDVVYSMSETDAHTYESKKLNIEKGAVLKITDGSHWYGYHDGLPFVSTNEFGDLVFTHSGSFKIFLNNKKEVRIKMYDVEEELQNNNENKNFYQENLEIVDNSLVDIEHSEIDW